MTVSIQDITKKINELFSNDQLFTAVLLILVAVTSFGLGKMSNSSQSNQSSSVRDGDGGGVIEPIFIDESKALTPSTQLVASKNSTKYHLPWCPGAEQISDTNKIYFTNEKEAVAAGYQPAGNCEGI